LEVQNDSSMESEMAGPNEVYNEIMDDDDITKGRYRFCERNRGMIPDELKSFLLSESVM
jgi:hypothetical protein